MGNEADRETGQAAMWSPGEPGANDERADGERAQAGGDGAGAGAGAGDGRDAASDARGRTAGPLGRDDRAEAWTGPGRRSIVEVAVDAPGASKTYTYVVPERLAGIEPGEAVLVEFGRGRQALGIVLGPAGEGPAGEGPAGEGSGPGAADDGPAAALGDVRAGEPGAVPGAELKPIVARVRADGPLLPPLALAFGRWIAAEYLAPPAAVLRAMLPPGMLERLELVAEWRPRSAETGKPAALGAAAVDRVERDLETRLAEGPRPVRDLEGVAGLDGRQALLRRLREMASRGLLGLEWTLTAATAGPRYERWLVPTDAGRDAARALATGRPVAERGLGPRQRGLLAELAAAAETGVAGVAASQRHGAGTATSLVRRGLAISELRERPRRPLERRRAGRRGTRPPGAELTAPQGAALEAILSAAAAHDPTPVLLEGVTGAGKTAVYAEAIAETLAAGRPALVLVPEIALALPLVDRLRADLEAEIALLHSGLGEGERADEWRRIRAGAVDVVVGTRTALLAPLADVGLIVVDEEHDASYKSDRTPRFQARDAATALARLAGAPVVLGSATPSVESVGRVRLGGYRGFVLPERPSGAPPRVEIVDLRAELATGNRGLLSGALRDALSGLPEGERAILVINRRGTASVVVCRDCGHVQRCPECERSLVFHQAGVTLRCHHCGTASPLARRCPSCRSPRIRYLGGGTQRIEEEVRATFPALRVGRLDRDVAEHRGAAERVLDAFAEGRLDVLVGTSLVSKGLDVPEVTLVGVVSADVALNLPDERAAERTFQFLSQAIGRAGRGERSGLAIVQTYQPDHPAIRAVATGDAAAFYDAELETRRRFGSPPFGRLVKLTCGLPDALAAEQEAAAMADRLRAAASDHRVRVAVLGPAPAYVARRAGRWRWNVVLRGDRPLELLDPPPGRPWSIDVDPDSLL